MKSEEEYLQLKDEDEARLVEEAMLKSEQEERSHLKAEEEAFLVEDASKEANYH